MFPGINTIFRRHRGARALSARDISRTKLVVVLDKTYTRGCDDSYEIEDDGGGRQSTKVFNACVGS